MSSLIIPPSTSFPNVYHQDKFQISFSNLPSLQTIKDMRLYDNYVKSVTIPEYSMAEMYSEGMGMRIRHQVAGIRANEDLANLTIEFKLSEDFKNYLNLFEFMRALKYGQIGNFNSEEEMFRKYAIHSINLNILDNEKRTIAVIRFTQAFLLNLSSINLLAGVSEEVVFSTTWSYEELLYDTISVTGI